MEGSKANHVASRGNGSDRHHVQEALRILGTVSCVLSLTLALRPSKRKFVDLSGKILQRTVLTFRKLPARANYSCQSSALEDF